MNNLLEIQGLKTEFRTDKGLVKAVDDLDLKIHVKETVGLVGESGCGKSVTSLSIMRLIPSPPGRIAAGRILFKSRDILTLSEPEMRRIRGKEIAMIFQEPMTSLNPVFTIGDQIAEALVLHEKMKKKQALKQSVELLKTVSIPDPEKRIKEYPHQLSGGMRQRVMIAMALACRPSLLIADEPTTALDVTIQAQILDVLAHLKASLGLSMLLITHDLGVVAETADRIAVMYAGKIIEEAEVNELFKHPLHPYTQGLLNSIPRLDKKIKKRRLATIEGTVPGMVDLPPGCAFRPRCRYARSDCADSQGIPLNYLSANHRVRCVLHR